MSDFMRRMGLASSLGMLVMLGACGGDEKKPTDTSDTTDTTDTADTDTPDTDTTPDVDPDTDETDTVTPTYATLTFTIDDSANKTYDASDKLAWKGSFTWDEATNLLTFDASWGGGSGPYPLLYDDGPPPTGHEKPGAVAGDGIWTTAVQFATPDQNVEFEYGAAWGDGASNWIWQGTNGKFTVPAGETGQVDAIGLTIAAQGTVDFKLTIDVSGEGANLDFVFGESEYKNADGPAIEGVKAYIHDGTTWVDATIAKQPDGDKNTYITVPSDD